MKSSSPRLCLIDDDSAVRSSLQFLLRDVKVPLVMYPSGREFFDQGRMDEIGCILLNQRMPHMSGSQVLERLRQDRIPIPVIFLTGYADVPFAVSMTQRGAFDVLEKPFEERVLLERVQNAFARFEQRRQARTEKAVLAERIERLTRREREVMILMATGLKNKDIAKKMEISPKTLDIHRTKVMEKMEARTAADVVRWELYAQADEENWPGSLGHL